MRDQGRRRSATGCTSSAARRPARRGSTWCSPCCAPRRCGAARAARCPGLRAALAGDVRPGRGGAARRARARRSPVPAGADATLRRRAGGAPAPTSSTCSRRVARRLVVGHGDAGLGRREGAGGRRRGARRGRADGVEAVAGASPPTEVVPRLAATTDEIDRRAAARWTAATSPAGPVRLADPRPGQRAADRPQLLLRRPEGDPVAATPGTSASALADSLLARHLADTGEYPRSVGLTVWGTSAMRTQGDDIAEVLALLGCRPVWDDASRRVTGFEVVPLAELGRPRIDVTVRISGLLPRRVPARRRAARRRGPRRSPRWTSPPSRTTCARTSTPTSPSTATGGAPPPRIFGSKPGAYGAGLLPLIDARNWRSDADLAEVYAVWGGYAYGRGLDGRRGARRTWSARSAGSRSRRRTPDTREHDIVDSDDYFQYHGGMVAMVRAPDRAPPGGVRRRLRRARRR